MHCYYVQAVNEKFSPGLISLWAKVYYVWDSVTGRRVSTGYSRETDAELVADWLNEIQYRR